MDIERIKSRITALVLDIPEVAAWPEMAAQIEVTLNQPGQFWKLPLLACQAVGSDVDRAIPASAAIASVHPGFVLVDDMLDNDPRGAYHRIGSGQVANLAFALQAASIRLINQADISPVIKLEITHHYAEALLATTLGQHWDAQNNGDEDDYWRILRAKNTPLFGFAMYAGARLGDASLQLAAGLRSFGALFCELVQLYDDLKDAFDTPAGPDWQRERNNLLILYALDAQHADRNRFEELVPQFENPGCLHEAQQILLRSGAVSYCFYHVAQRHQKAVQLLESLALANPDLLSRALAQQVEPLYKLFERVGVMAPAGTII